MSLHTMVVGGGALGSILAAHLGRSGERVTCFLLSMFALLLTHHIVRESVQWEFVSSSSASSMVSLSDS